MMPAMSNDKALNFTDDPRVPVPDHISIPILREVWGDGYAAALADMDNGRFDRPTPAEIRAAQDYGFIVGQYHNGIDYVEGAWVVLHCGSGSDAMPLGGVFDSLAEANAEMVRRWREEIKV